MAFKTAVSSLLRLISKWSKCDIFDYLNNNVFVLIDFRSDVY